jgi:hypothetical protein
MASRIRRGVYSSASEVTVMRKFMYALVLLALATPLFAKDPFAGTWKLNSEKTKYTVGAPAKNVTVVMDEQGANLQVTATGTYDNGSPLSVKYAYPVKGGMGIVHEGDFDSINVKMVSDHVREIQYMKDGKELRTRRMVLSGDGKTMQSTVKGINAMGQHVEGVDFFDRQ